MIFGRHALPCPAACDPDDADSCPDDHRCCREELVCKDLEAFAADACGEISYCIVYLRIMVAERPVIDVKMPYLGNKVKGLRRGWLDHSGHYFKNKKPFVANKRDVPVDLLCVCRNSELTTAAP